MYNILTLNKIAAIGTDNFNKAYYNVAETSTTPTL